MERRNDGAKERWNDGTMGRWKKERGFAHSSMFPPRRSFAMGVGQAYEGQYGKWGRPFFLLSFVLLPSVASFSSCTTTPFLMEVGLARMERRTRLVSIVVPTYNERQNLPRLVASIQQYLKHRAFEIIVVDDASPDGTAELARDLARTHPIRVLSRPAKSGLGSAYRDGFRAAQGDLVFEMDADLSHDPRYIPALIEAVEQGADVAVGSRYVAQGRVVGWNAYRRIVSGVGNALAKVSLGLPTRDVTSGFRCYAREAADIVQLVQSDGYAFQVEVLYLARKRGFRVAEVPITFENRTVGKSKLGPGEFARFLQTLARLRLGRPTHAGRAPAKPA